MSKAVIWLVFILGLWLVVIRGFGTQWALVPGDLGDGRFNNYVLEHFFRWVKGLDPEYWNAPFFYPYPNVIAFSDNLLGSAPFYALLRWTGLSRETAFQSWYVFGFFLNYAAAGYVLSRYKFNPFAVGIGAAFYTFGLPLLAQETHLQLFYRFGIPLACFCLLEFLDRPKLTRLAALVFWIVWQFYLSIYLGFFLIMLLVVLIPLMLFFERDIRVMEQINLWPGKLKQAWFQTNFQERVISLVVMSGAGVGLVALLLPYYQVSKNYGFTRDWVTVSAMLPTLKSFFIADSSLLWKTISANVSDVSMRNEHQLFPGIVVSVLLLVGLALRFKSKNSRLAWLHLGAVLLLVIFTLNIKGYSFYWLLWKIPGINSIRAVTRIQLVLMWPIALFCAWVTDEIMLRTQKKPLIVYYSIGFLVAGLLLIESALFTNINYPKADGLLRLTQLKQRIPSNLPPNSILSVAYDPNKPDFVAEIDVMLVSQEMGLPTLNGYSGNFPQGYNLPTTCEQIPNQVKKYFKAVNMPKEARLKYYLATMKRIVPLGFQDCNPSWWRNMP